jgi:DNA-binding response OmpR family regulator
MHTFRLGADCVPTQRQLLHQISTRSPSRHNRLSATLHPMSSGRIAVIEDEQTIASAVAARLRTEGFDVEIANDGPAGVDLVRRFVPDLVVLDLMLPGLDGIEVCREIQRDRQVPVVMLTARDSETDKLVGLGVGADDYMTKPFSSRELVARIRAVLRRVGRDPEPEAPVLRYGDFELDPARRDVRRDGRRIHLTPTEFDLLHFLAKTPHVVYGRPRLLREVWGYRGDAGVRTVDSHIRALRRKLGTEVIRTVHGIGYAFSTHEL